MHVIVQYNIFLKHFKPDKKICVEQLSIWNDMFKLSQHFGLLLRLHCTAAHLYEEEHRWAIVFIINICYYYLLWLLVNIKVIIKINNVAFVIHINAVQGTQHCVSKKSENFAKCLTYVLQQAIGLPRHRKEESAGWGRFSRFCIRSQNFLQNKVKILEF